MKLKSKLLLGFSLIIVLNLILGGLLYNSFANVSANVREIQEKSSPAKEAIADLRLHLAWMYAAHAELTNGATVLKDWMFQGATLEYAQQKAEPYFVAAEEKLDKEYFAISQAQMMFNDTGFLDDMDYTGINTKIATYNKILNGFEELAVEYRAADFDKASTIIKTLDAAALEADTALEEVEAAIDAKVAGLNAETEAAASQAVMMIIIFNAVAVILGLGLSLWLSGMIASPIQKLTAAANSIGDGQIDTELPNVKTRDEVKELADAMETMRGAIVYLKSQ